MKSNPPNQALEPTTLAATACAPSSTSRVSLGRGSSLTLGKKLNIPPKYLSLLLAFFIPPCEGAITFRGLTTFSEEMRFALVSSDGLESRWCEVGDRFDGYAVLSYDAHAHELILQRESEVIRLALAEPRTMQGPLEGDTRHTIVVIDENRLSLGGQPCSPQELKKCFASSPLTVSNVVYIEVSPKTDFKNVLTILDILGACKNTRIVLSTRSPNRR